MYYVLKLAQGSLFFLTIVTPCLVLILIFFFLIFGSLFLLTAGGALMRAPGLLACAQPWGLYLFLSVFNDTGYRVLPAAGWPILLI